MPAFWKSVLFGTLTGGGPFAVPITLLAISILWSDRNFIGVISAILFPFLVAFPIVLGSSVLVGLPVTFLLKKRGWENVTTYVFLGVIVGFFVPIIVLLIGNAEGGYPLAMLGALSGGVTARTWWVSGREPYVSHDD